MSLLNESKSLQLIEKMSWAHAHGKKNAIVDVGDIRVGHLTISRDDRDSSGAKIPIRTGLTAIVPGDLNDENRYFFGLFPYRNLHEITGYAVTEDFCYLNSPILLTNLYDVGTAYDAVLSYGFQLGRVEIWPPVVLSIDDSYLNAQTEPAVDDKDVIRCLQNSSNQSVEEGSVGIGLGLQTSAWKGGIGTSSRLFSIDGKEFSVGALVASNSGSPYFSERANEDPEEKQRRARRGSLTLVLATDMPLLPYQIKMVSAGVVVSLPSVHMIKNETDSINCLLFSLANPMSLKNDGPKVFDYVAVDDSTLSILIRAGLESVAEALLRSLCLSRSVSGKQDRKTSTISEDSFLALLEQFEKSLGA